MGKYAKALIAASGFLAVLASVTADGVIVADEYETVAIAAVTAVGVFLKRNKPSA